MNLNRRYRVTADQYQFTLNRRTIPRKGPKKGTEVLTPIGYYATPAALLTGLGVTMARDLVPTEGCTLADFQTILDQVAEQVESTLLASLPKKK